MMVNFQYYLGNFLIYPYLVIFFLYVIGRPKFVVSRLARLLDFKLYRGYTTQTITLIAYTLGIISNIYDREKKLQELTEASIKHDITDERFNVLKKTIFLCERGIFLYLSFLVLTIVFMKFSEVYSKKFKLEDELESLKAVGSEKNAKDKKND